MKKSSNVTPRELIKRRIAKSKLMKIPNNEGKFSNKENENPHLVKYNTRYKIHDREIKGENLPNPFEIPNHTRLFSKSSGQRKVKPEPFIMSEPHTICDIYDAFYKAIEGRPLRQFTDVKVYMRNIRDITLYKANAGYLNDQILQFQLTHQFEVEQYNQIDNLYEISKKNFVHFAEESYSKAKAIQETAEIKALELTRKTDELEGLCFEYVKLRNQVSSIMFSFQTLSIYSTFLNSLAPDWWREEFDYLYAKKKVQLCPTTMQNDVGAASVASIDEYKISIAKFKKILPRLYFKKPKQIISLFESLSEQCLNYMKIDGLNAKIVTSVQKSRDFLKTMVKAEINELEDFIELYKSNLKYMEQKEMDYKAVFERVLFSEFQTLYASPDTIKLFTCVQYVNSTIFGGSEDPKDRVSLMMQCLERQFMELSLNMDKLDLEIVKKATSQMYAEDLKIMKRAYLAQRNLKECAILSKALYTSFEPPRPSIKAAKISEKSKDK